MTPAELETAWPQGITPQGAILLTLAKHVRDDPEAMSVMAASLENLGENLTSSLGFATPGFSFTVTPGEVENGVWRVQFEMSQPASDAMAYFLNGIASMSEEIGGLYSEMNVDATTFEPHARVLQQVAPWVAVDADGARIAQDAFADHLDEAVILSVPNAGDLDEDLIFDAIFAVMSLVEVGCFNLAGMAEEYEYPEEYLFWHEAGQPAEAGFLGFRGDPAVFDLLIACIQTAIGQPILSPRITLRHEDSIL